MNVVFRHALVVGAAFCLLAPGCVPVGDVAWQPRESAPAWVETLPAGCALGFSGPTLSPADQVVYAQSDAREKLAWEKFGVSLESFYADLPEGPAEVTTQEASGFLDRVRVVTTWLDRTGVGPERKWDVLYALACTDAAKAEGVPRPAIPDWLAEVPWTGGRLCALGLAGPTFHPKDQEPNARADARERLAEALSVHVRVFGLDIDRQDFSTAGESGAETWAHQVCAARATDQGTWRDAKAEGPLARTGVVYALACLETR